MPWYIWLAAALIVASTLASVSSIGKPRTPLSANTAVFVVLINGLLLWALLAAGAR